jgi:hypothetical protein
MILLLLLLLLLVSRDWKKEVYEPLFGRACVRLIKE